MIQQQLNFHITTFTLRFIFALALLGCTAPLIAGQQQPRVGGAARLESWKKHVQMANESPFAKLPWQRLGPKFVGGRIESIDAPRGDLGTIYAGVGAGGVWKTTNGGLTWKPIFQNESTFAIGDLTIAPSDSNTIWVGTGECHLSRTSYAGNGVYRSIDAGETWTHMGLEETAHIGKIVIDPKNKDVVYVAAMGRKDTGGQRGLFKTSDGGKSFEHILKAEPQVAFVDLVLDPFDNTRLYAAGWDRSGRDRGGVFLSEDAGKTWRRLGGGLLQQSVDRIAIDVASSQEGVVYALMADRSTPELAKRRNASILFRSDDGGETWNRTNEGYVPTYIGWDFCDLRVAPDNADRIYIGGLRLITSDDGGKSFQGEGGFAFNTALDTVFRLHPHRGIGMHLDVHDIWIDPEHPERVMLGNDGGLYLSNDRAQTWLHLNSLPIAEFYRIHLDDDQPFKIWGGTQDNASLVGPSSARFEAGVDDQWDLVFLDPWSGGDGFATFPDPLDASITYYTQQNGDLKRSRLGNLRPEKSIRPRRGNTTAYQGEEAIEHQSDQRNFNFAWDTPFFPSVHQNNADQTVLYCAAERVFRSEDRGDHWQAISPDLGIGALIEVSESPCDPQRLAAVGGRGNVFLTRDGGKQWLSVGEGLPKKAVRDVLLSAHSPDTCYVVLSGKSDHDCAAYVFVSHDFGKSWNSISKELPNECVNVIAEDGKSNDLLFVGTDLGVYASTDRGESWNSLCGTLPTASVVDLKVQSRDGALVAASHGLSLFLLDIAPIRNALDSASKN